MTAAAAEYERVREKYAPIRRRDIALYVVASVALGIASVFRQVDWFLWVGLLTGVVGWEITKLRLRRNARDFAAASQ